MNQLEVILLWLFVTVALAATIHKNDTLDTLPRQPRPTCYHSVPLTSECLDRLKFVLLDYSKDADILHALARHYHDKGDFESCYQYSQQLFSALSPSPSQWKSWRNRSNFREHYPILASRCALDASQRFPMGSLERLARLEFSELAADVTWRQNRRNARYESHLSRIVSSIGLVRAALGERGQKTVSLSYYHRQTVCDDFLITGKGMWKRNLSISQITPFYHEAAVLCPERLAPYYEIAYMYRKTKQWALAMQAAQVAFALPMPQTGHRIRLEHFIYKFRLPVTLSMISYNSQSWQTGIAAVARIGAYRKLTANTLHSLKIFSHKLDDRLSLFAQGGLVGFNYSDPWIAFEAQYGQNVTLLRDGYRYERTWAQKDQAQQSPQQQQQQQQQQLPPLVTDESLAIVDQSPVAMTVVLVSALDAPNSTFTPLPRDQQEGPSLELLIERVSAALDPKWAKKIVVLSNRAPDMSRSSRRRRSKAVKLPQVVHVPWPSDRAPRFDDRFSLSLSHVVPKTTAMLFLDHLTPMNHQQTNNDNDDGNDDDDDGSNNPLVEIDPIALRQLVHVWKSVPKDTPGVGPMQTARMVAGWGQRRYIHLGDVRKDVYFYHLLIPRVLVTSKDNVKLYRDTVMGGEKKQQQQQQQGWAHKFAERWGECQAVLFAYLMTRNQTHPDDRSAARVIQRDVFPRWRGDTSQDRDRCLYELNTHYSRFPLPIRSRDLLPRETLANVIGGHWRGQPMLPIQREVMALLRDIEQAHEPVSLARYNDGEYRLMQGYKWQGWSGWSVEEGMSGMGRDLMLSMRQLRPKSYIYGIPCINIRPWLEFNLLQMDKPFESSVTYATVLMENLPYVLDWLDRLRHGHGWPQRPRRKVVVISNQHAGPPPFADEWAGVPFEVVRYWEKPKQAQQLKDMMERLVARNPNSTLFLLAAGPAAKPLIALGHQLAPSNQYIDMGSPMMTVLSQRSTRVMHKRHAIVHTECFPYRLDQTRADPQTLSRYQPGTGDDPASLLRRFGQEGSEDVRLAVELHSRAMQEQQVQAAAGAKSKSLESGVSEGYADAYAQMTEMDRQQVLEHGALNPDNDEEEQ